MARDRSLERHTGHDAKLKWDAGDGFTEIPVTNVSWDREHTNNDVQHNGSLSPTMTTTGIRYSGSFEYSGQNPDILTNLIVSEGEARAGSGVRGILSIREYNHDTEEKEVTYTFRRVKINNMSRDLPSDGSSSTTVDWDAEEMDITEA